jgi:hypothetical protein
VLGLRCHRRGRNRNRTTGANSTRALPPTGSVRAFTRRNGGCQQCDAGGTAPLDHIVHHLALALGGRSAASFARRLMLPVSNDTSTPRAQTRHSGLRGLDSSRDRRLGVATQPALRDNHLRSRTSQNDRVAPRLRTQRPRFSSAGSIVKRVTVTKAIPKTQSPPAARLLRPEIEPDGLVDELQGVGSLVVGSRVDQAGPCYLVEEVLPAVVSHRPMPSLSVSSESTAPNFFHIRHRKAISLSNASCRSDGRVERIAGVRAAV